MPDMLKQALMYAKKGFSVIPIIPDERKKPHVEWAKYQKERASTEQIEKWWKDWPLANVAIVTGVISKISVIDIDLYKMTDEEKEEIKLLLPKVDTPVAKSPKGGRHLYFKYHADLPTKSNILKHVDGRNNGGYIVAPPSRINGSSYEWKPGKHPLNAIPKEHISNIKHYLGLGGGKQLTTDYKPLKTTKATSNHISFEDGTRDEGLFHTANCLVKGKMAEGDIYQVLERLILSWGEKPDPKWISAKISSAIKRSAIRDRSITKDVEDWVLTTEGNFRTTDCHNELQLTTKDHKKACMMALLRLVDAGVIERNGTQRGCYRLIERHADEINWWDASNKEIPFKMVFGLERYVKFLPKTLTVIAGSQDAGKSALLLNIAFLNINTHPVYYFSSEMDGAELRDRIELFENYDLGVLKKIKFKERSSNFADVIDPDGINIIDFIEITDNFYRIAQDFTNIRNKLKKGIALIALQKDKNNELGRGGSFSLEKPRLYLSLDKDFPGNILKVVKAKNWRDPEVNPNGFVMKFKLFKGVNLHPKGIWEPE